MTTQHEPTSPAPPFPRGTICPRCGYDLSGTQTGRCSECGRPYSAADAVAAANRVQVSVERRQLIGGLLGGAILFSGCFGLPLARLGPWAVMVGAFLSVVPLAAVSLAGLIPSICTRRHLRAAAYWAWLRATCTLHLAWIASTSVGVAAVILGPGSHDDGGMLLMAGVCVLLAVNALVGWWTMNRLLGQWRAIGLTEFGIGRWVALLVVCNIGTLAMSIVSAYIGAIGTALIFKFI